MCKNPSAKAEGFFLCNFFTGDVDLLGVQVFVADDKICPVAGGNSADLLAVAQGLGRIYGGRKNSFFLGDTESDGIQHTLVQIGCRSGNGAVSQFGNATLQEHLLAAQLILASGIPQQRKASETSTILPGNSLKAIRTALG